MGMRKIWVGLGILLLSATAAEAQVLIDPVGPTCIESDDVSTIYRATVTTIYDFEYSLKVYRNSVLVDSSLEYVVNDGPSYSYARTFDCSRWGMATGNTILFRAKATIMEGPFLGVYDTDNLSLTVSAPGTCFLEPRRRQDESWA